MNRSKSRLPVIARKDGYAMNRFDRDRLDAMGKEALSRVEELMNTSRINELMHERDFPALRIGNRIVVPKEAFIQWVEQHTGGTE